MNMIKTIFGNRGTRIWFIVAVVVTALLAVVTVLANTVFFVTISSLMGGRRPIFGDGIQSVYLPDYESKEETLGAANKFNETLCEEGFVLLKNDDGTLPLRTPVSDGSVSGKPKISVFGKNSVNIALGGSGSGGGSGGVGARSIYDSLDAAGYETNETLKTFYENNSLSGPARSANSSDLSSGDTVVLSTAETPQSMYPSAVRDSYSRYNDAALVVFTRIGGEGFDLPRSMKGAVGANEESDHFLQLDKNETDLLKAVCAEDFGHVIVIINAGTAMEVSFLEDPDHYAYQAKIDAALWIGFPGNSGIMALGRILNGEINPSGRTTDTYAADFTANPVWENFGDNLTTGDAKNGILGGDQYYMDGKIQNYYFVDYEESVYVGYRYYETRGETDDEEWYDKNVVYPFGYGLSYTDFAWEVNASSIEDKTVSNAEKYEIEIAVTNIGGERGRDVVELYGYAPYIPGGIEKPSKVLLDFAKTVTLNKGETEVVTLEFDPYYLASYDYNDANNNGFKGYELDAGNDYRLLICKNAHKEKVSVPFSVGKGGIRFDSDPITSNAVVNRYTGRSNTFFDSDTQLSDVAVNGETRKGLSRSGWKDTWPTVPDGERYVDREFIDALKDVSHNNPIDYGEEDMPYFDEPVEMVFRDMVTTEEGVYGIAANTKKWEAFVDYDDDRWARMLDQCAAKELLNMFNLGAFHSSEIERIGKPLTNDTDGPSGFVNFIDKSGTYHGTCYYACQTIVGSTWNPDAAFGFGEMVGNEGIWGAADRGNGLPYSGWYAPGVNIHRSPFGGRNFEYFSEDPTLTGKLAAAQIRGAQSKGVYCFIKHFALNDQETHRSIDGLCTWATEQSMREIYLRPFEIAVKEGKTRAVMSSFNRIGTRWTGGDYRLMTEILRDEWGFKGTVICDFNSGEYMDPKQMIYAGGDLNLNNQTTKYCWDDFDAGSVADAVVLRNAAKNVFYTVINSNAMNAEIIGYDLPIWTIILIIADCAVAAGLAIWGFFAVRKALKRRDNLPQ